MISTKYSISAASRITGKSRTTIAKHLKEGKLSSEDDGAGARVIDASELIRVYGDACRFDAEEGARDPSSPKAADGRGDQSGQPDLPNVQRQLDDQIKERERERQQFQQQIEHLKDALKLAQEGQNKAMLLLEHGKAGGGEWEQKIKALEARIANQEEGATKAKAELAVQAKRDALKEIKDKPWWQIAFGH
jgi:peptidoglycan hydrolase CwlO-like protein